MPAGLGLVLPHVVHHVHDDHEEPHEHGHQHGHVGGFPLQAAEVHPRIQQLDERLPRVLALRPRVLPPAALAHPPHGALTHDPVHRFGLEVQSLHQLLQGAVAVPGVVVEARLCSGGAELLPVGLSQQVVGEVQQAQLGAQVPQGPRGQRVDAVVGQVQVPQVDQVAEGPLRDVPDGVAFQVERDGFRWDPLWDLPQPGVWALHRGRVPGTVAAVRALGRHPAPQSTEQDCDAQPWVKIHWCIPASSSTGAGTCLLTPACAHRVTIAPRHTSGPTQAYTRSHQEILTDWEKQGQGGKDESVYLHTIKQREEIIMFKLRRKKVKVGKERDTEIGWNQWIC